MNTNPSNDTTDKDQEWRAAKLEDAVSEKPKRCRFKITYPPTPETAAQPRRKEWIDGLLCGVHRIWLAHQQKWIFNTWFQVVESETYSSYSVIECEVEQET